MVETIEIVSNNKLCIICLEELDDNIMKACDTCDINCHIFCLYKWYIKNKDESCPICLKKTNIHNIVKNKLFENREELNNEELNDRDNIDIINNNIQQLYDNEEDYRKDKIASYILFAILILVLIMVLFMSL